MASRKIAYAASSTLTTTNLDGLASSSTHLGGWESAAIDNSTNLYLDYLISGTIVVESAGLSAGQIRVHIVGEKEDASWPDVFDGTESAETVTDTEIRDAICRLGALLETDTTASRTYHFGPFSVAALFGGICPRKFVVFLTQSTGTTLEATGTPNKVYQKGVYETVA